eukprot:CAMPEP_0204585230 /NCGR_PEP_ID=MMETSP0661-20131031/46799_1 /ASSEMBLY_ACC=CAM_ASM_000606 /TAXON_ID=109239 /ORGANISM="Alexandrium margalefi, Strain AMGDE01CS-322" /LENGTH=174 /DNA_ID=CAMNT_0051594761 /DNA_START=35 /DNA_END=559 /DNA_ORIENTATION=-
MKPSLGHGARQAMPTRRLMAAGPGRRSPRCGAALVALALALIELTGLRATFVGGARQLVLAGLPRTRRCASRAGGGSSDDKDRLGEMTLEEEFRTGRTLESEFSQVLEARRRGKDIRREPGIDVKSDLEVNARRAWRQATEAVSGVDLSNGPTLFWALMIGLIVVAWLLPLLPF